MDSNEPHADYVPPKSYDDLYDDAPVGYLTVDMEDRVVRLNRTLLNWLGLQPHQLVGRRWTYMLLGVAARMLLATHVQPLVRMQGVARGVALDLKCRDGRRLPVLATFANVLDDSGAPCGRRIAFIEAVEREHYQRQLLDAKRRAESALESLHELTIELERRVELRTAELTRANRQLDSFTQAVSHDLRAPVRAMRGYAALLLDEYGATLDERGRSMLGSIDRAAHTMAQLIEALLDLSSTTRGELQLIHCNLSEIVERIRSELAQQEPQRQVEWRIEPGLQARADPRMLEAALRNLIGNAWKYTSKTSTPCISFTRDGAAFCISDNGVGFDLTHAAGLFQPFRRMHSSAEFPGLGIGLATVHRIIERHGGAISVDAAPGQGATFRFTLPDARSPC